MLTKQEKSRITKKKNEIAGIMNLPAAMDVINSAIAMNNISRVSNFLFIYGKMLGVYDPVAYSVPMESFY
jgi:hypothetical protein